MQEIRTILAYLEGKTDDIGKNNGLSPSQWQLVKRKLEEIKTVLDKAPAVVVTHHANGSTSAAGGNGIGYVALPPKPNPPTIKEWCEAFKATAITGGMTRIELDDMDDEIKGFYGPEKDPAEAARNYVEAVFRG